MQNVISSASLMEYKAKLLGKAHITMTRLQEVGNKNYEKEMGE